jgi:hypothetical protein
MLSHLSAYGRNEILLEDFEGFDSALQILGGGYSFLCTVHRNFHGTELTYTAGACYINGHLNSA